MSHVEIMCKITIYLPICLSDCFFLSVCPSLHLHFICFGVCGVRVHGWMCVFVDTHAHTLSLLLSPNHSHTHTHTLSLSLFQSLTHTLSLSLFQPLTHTSHTHIHIRTHVHTHPAGSAAEPFALLEGGRGKRGGGGGKEGKPLEMLRKVIMHVEKEVYSCVGSSADI